MPSKSFPIASADSQRFSVMSFQRHTGILVKFGRTYASFGAKGLRKSSEKIKTAQTSLFQLEMK